MEPQMEPLNDDPEKAQTNAKEVATARSRDRHSSKERERKSQEQEARKSRESGEDNDDDDAGSLEAPGDGAPPFSPLVSRGRDCSQSSDRSTNRRFNFKTGNANPTGYDSRGKKLPKSPEAQKPPEVLAREQELRQRMATYRLVAEQKEAAALEARKLAKAQADAAAAAAFAEARRRMVLAEQAQETQNNSRSQSRRVKSPLQRDQSPRSSAGGGSRRPSRDASPRPAGGGRATSPRASGGGLSGSRGSPRTPSLRPSSPRARSPRAPPGLGPGMLEASPSISLPSELTPGLTPAMARRIGDLERQKLDAVENEDYALAFKLKNRIMALKSEAASVDLLDKPMVGTGDSNGDGGGKSASRARNMSLSPRSGPKATPTQKELAEASALEKRFAKDFKLDDAGEEVARVKTLFQSACTRYKTKDLSRNAFKYLVKQLIKASGEKQALPSDNDLDTAFDLADEDGGGTVDEDEFLHMYELVKKGDVKGLSGTSLSNTSPRQKGNLEKKQEKFKKSLAEAKETKRTEHRRTAAEVAADLEADHVERNAIMEAQRRSQGYHGREMMSSVLLNAHDDFARRTAHGNTTQALDMGHLATSTAASRHHNDKVQLSRIEQDLKNQKEERESMSKELEKAKLEFQKRMARQKILGLHNTVADNIGNLSTGTVATSHQHDKYDADHVGEGELILHARVHARQEMGAELSKQKALWENRQASGKLHTEADKLGHFATDTVASSHQHDAYDADHVGEGELIAHSRLHEREELGAELSKQKAAWEKRQAAGKLHTEADKLGHFATDTVASSHQHDAYDADHVGEGELIAHSRLHERGELGAELSKQKAAWEKRQAAGKLHTEADKLGHFATETAASLHHHDALDADHAPESELIAHSRLHEREELGAAALKEKAAWEQRQKAGKLHTETDKLGHFATDTAASAHHHDGSAAYDADHVPEGELIAHSRLHEREELGAAALKEKAAWEKRQKAGTLHTEASKLGHYAIVTEATKHHHDNDKIPGGNHFGKDFEHDRAELGEESLKQKAIYEKRQKEGKLHTQTDKLGHFAAETTGSSHHPDALDANYAPESELVAHSRLHEREELAAAALKEKAAWENRQKADKLQTTTETVERGPFSTETEESKNRHGSQDKTDANSPRPNKGKKLGSKV